MDSDAKTVHFSVPRINLCFKMADTQPPPKFDWTKGCVFVQSGQIFYSPNCNRPVVIPPRPNFCHPVFEQKPLDARNFKQPVWWDDSYGWMSFIPLCPSFTAALFEPFCWLPPILELAIPQPENCLETEIQHEYQMDPLHADIWNDYETKMIECARVMRIWYQVQGNLPPTPSSFGYTRKYRTRAKALKMIYLARDWFGVWIGYLSYLIAMIQASPTEKNRHPVIPEWYFRLLELCDDNRPAYSEDYLDGLMSSTVCRFDSNIPRAGVIFQWSWYRQYRPSINFFHDHYIPMYFPWTLEEEREIDGCPELKVLRPPSDMVNSALNILFKEPSLPLASLLLKCYTKTPGNDSNNPARGLLNFERPPIFVEQFLYQKASLELNVTPDLHMRDKLLALLQEHKSSHMESVRIAASLPTQRMIRHNASEEEAQLFHDWRDFFERRERRQREIIMVEDEDARSLRISRSLHPEIETAAVYLWQKIRSSGGIYLFVRVRVPIDKNLDYVNNYIKSQRVYNSISNEWDLCYHFTPPSHFSHEVSNQGEDDELYWGTYEDEDILPFPQDSGGFSGASEELFPDESQISPSVDTDNSGLIDQKRVQQFSMIKSLFYCYGYVHPLGSTAVVPSSLSTTWSLVSQALGFMKDGSERALIKQERESITCFVEKLVKNVGLPADLFDLHDDHYYPLSLSRFIDMQFICRPSRNLFVISGPSSKSSEWALGLESAVGAMYALCVLSSKTSHTVATVAHLLLSYGVTFRTLHRFDGLSTQETHGVTAPYIPTSFCKANYTFTIADYHASMLKCQQVLSKPSGRAALLKGGIIGRIARQFLSEDEVLEGPSIEVTKHSSGVFFPSSTKTCSYGDDELTEQDLADICCTYSMYTDLESQVCVKSWWPPHSVWFGNRTGCRWLEWTERNEHFFVEHRQSILSGNAQPLRANQWKEKLRGHVYTRRMLDNSEILAQAYVDKYLPVQESV